MTSADANETKNTEETAAEARERGDAKPDGPPFKGERPNRPDPDRPINPNRPNQNRPNQNRPNPGRPGKPEPEPQQPATLEAARAEMEKLRGRPWAFPEIDPRKTALVALDLTNAALRETPRYQPLATKVDWIAEALRDAGGRVAWTRPGPQTSPLLEEIFGEREAAKRRAASDAGDKRGALWEHLGVRHGDMQATKTHYSAFYPGDCMLPHLLRSHGIDTLILAGVMTSVAVDSTARDAMAAGYRVIIAADACAARSPAEHDAALCTLHCNFGDVRETQDIITLIRRGMGAWRENS